MHSHYFYDYLRTFGAGRIGVCVFVNLLGISIWMIPATQCRGADCARSLLLFPMILFPCQGHSEGSLGG